MTARQPLSEDQQRDAERLKTVWDNFKNKAKENGEKVTQESVAEACGWSNQSAFGAYINKRTPINLEALIKLSNYFKVSPFEISPDLASLIASVSFTPDEQEKSVSENKLKIGKWVPVKAYSKMGSDGYYQEMGYCGDSGDGYVPSPTAGPNAYAIRGNGSSMYPEIRHGWYAICDPDASPTPTEFVEVQLKNGTRTIKEFIGISNGILHLLGVNGEKRITIEMAEVDAIVAIIGIVPPSRSMPEIPIK